MFGGEDSVMFASDWPHHDFDHPNKVLQIPVSPETQAKILGRMPCAFSEWRARIEYRASGRQNRGTPPRCTQGCTCRWTGNRHLQCTGQLLRPSNNCFHQNGPLCRGLTSGTIEANESTGWKPTWVREGEIVICPWHTLEFDIKTGRAWQTRDTACRLSN